MRITKADLRIIWQLTRTWLIGFVAGGVAGLIVRWFLNR